MTENNRGESQQLQFLVRAAEKLEEAAELHEGSFRDPALAAADEAAAHIESYRKGPLLLKDGQVDDD